MLFAHVHRQEGWRLEHENIEDKASPIIFKGIVFNEMKGVFVSCLQVHLHCLQVLTLALLAFGSIAKS